MATVRLFASAREAAGTGSCTIEGSTVGEVLDRAVEHYGSRLATVLPQCKIWLNGEPTDRAQPVGPADEVAVLPPVSGG